MYKFTSIAILAILSTLNSTACKAARLEYVATNPGVNFTNRAIASGQSGYISQTTFNLAPASAGNDDIRATADIFHSGGNWAFRTFASVWDFGIPSVTATADTAAVFDVLPDPGETIGQPFTLYVSTFAYPNQFDASANDGRGLWGATSRLSIYGPSYSYDGPADVPSFTLNGFIGNRFTILTSAMAQTHYYFDQNAFSPPFTMYNNVAISAVSFVPEPSTVAMSTIVAFALAAVALRRRQSLR